MAELRTAAPHAVALAPAEKIRHGPSAWVLGLRMCASISLFTSAKLVIREGSHLPSSLFVWGGYHILRGFPRLKPETL